MSSFNGKSNNWKVHNSWPGLKIQQKRVNGPLADWGPLKTELWTEGRAQEVALSGFIYPYPSTRNCLFFFYPSIFPALHPFLPHLLYCASLDLHKWIIKENGLWLHNNYSQLLKNWKIPSWNIKKPEFSFARSPRERTIQRPHPMRTPAQCAGQSLENWTPTWGHLHTLMKTLQLKYTDDGRKLWPHFAAVAISKC